MTEIVVLLSAGRHPVTGRPRPSPSDARALQLALTIPDARITALHAGPTDEALRPYAGYGQADLVRLDVAADADPLPAIVAWIVSAAPRLVLTGCAAERGPAAGLLAYALAARIGAACIPEATVIESVGERITLIQAMEGGRRRRLTAPAPAVLTASNAAPAPPHWAYARTLRATIAVTPTAPVPSADHAARRTEPARPLARPVRKLRGGAAARLAAATSFTTGNGNLMVGPSPEGAAKAIADYLQAEGLLPR